MSKVKLCIFVAFNCLLPTVVHESIADAQPKIVSQEVFWEKRLANDQKIRVQRKEVAYTPPSSPKIKALEKAFGATVIFKQPTRMWEYSLVLLPSPNRQTKQIWRRNIAEYRGDPPVRFFDAYVEKESAVVLYWYGYRLHAWVTDSYVKAKFPNGKLSYIGQRPANAGDPLLTKANIRGKFAENSVAVELQRENERIERFAWKNQKWIEQVQKNGKWVDKPPPAPPAGVKTPQR